MIINKINKVNKANDYPVIFNQNSLNIMNPSPNNLMVSPITTSSPIFLNTQNIYQSTSLSPISNVNVGSSTNTYPQNVTTSPSIIITSTPSPHPLSSIIPMPPVSPRLSYYNINNNNGINNNNNNNINNNLTNMNGNINGNKNLNMDLGNDINSKINVKQQSTTPTLTTSPLLSNSDSLKIPNNTESNVNDNDKSKCQSSQKYEINTPITNNSTYHQVMNNNIPTTTNVDINVNVSAFIDTTLLNKSTPIRSSSYIKNGHSSSSHQINEVQTATALTVNHNNNNIVDVNSIGSVPAITINSTTTNLEGGSNSLMSKETNLNTSKRISSLMHTNKIMTSPVQHSNDESSHQNITELNPPLNSEKKDLSSDDRKKYIPELEKPKRTSSILKVNKLKEVNSSTDSKDIPSIVTDQKITCTSTEDKSLNEHNQSHEEKKDSDSISKKMDNNNLNRNGSLSQLSKPKRTCSITKSKQYIEKQENSNEQDIISSLDNNPISSDLNHSQSSKLIHEIKMENDSEPKESQSEN